MKRLPAGHDLSVCLQGEGKGGAGPEQSARHEVGSTPRPASSRGLVYKTREEKKKLRGSLLDKTNFKAYGISRYLRSRLLGTGEKLGATAKPGYVPVGSRKNFASMKSKRAGSLALRCDRRHGLHGVYLSAVDRKRGLRAGGKERSASPDDKKY